VAPDHARLEERPAARSQFLAALARRMAPDHTRTATRRAAVRTAATGIAARIVASDVMAQHRARLHKRSALRGQFSTALASCTTPDHAPSTMRRATVRMGTTMASHIATRDVMAADHARLDKRPAARTRFPAALARRTAPDHARTATRLAALRT
jgi:hypothetical protein